MSPCCVYGCMATKGITQVKATGGFYCEKHYPKPNTQTSTDRQPNGKSKSTGS